MKIGTIILFDDINTLEKKFKNLFDCGFDNCQLNCWNPTLFNDENADFINGLHDGVEGCIVADCGIGAAEIVINGGRDGDAWIVKLLGKYSCTMNGAVASDDNECIDALFDDVFVGFFTSVGIHKVFGW